MKKIKTIVLASILTLSISARSEAEPELRGMEATAYFYGEVTASGGPVQTGRCVGRSDWMGKCAIVYLREENGDAGTFI